MTDSGSDFGSQELYDLACRLYPQRSPERDELEAAPPCPDGCIFSHQE